VPIPSPQDIPLTLKQPEQSKTQQEMRRRAQRPRRTTVTRTQSRPSTSLKFCSVNSRRRSASRRGRSHTPIHCSVRNRCSNSSSSVQTGSQQYQQPAYASQQTGYQQQQQQPAHSYQQTGQQRQQPQSGYVSQQAGQSTRTR
jgi:hypothetical protein